MFKNAKRSFFQSHINLTEVMVPKDSAVDPKLVHNSHHLFPLSERAHWKEFKIKYNYYHNINHDIRIIKHIHITFFLFCILAEKCYYSFFFYFVLSSFSIKQILILEANDNRCTLTGLLY